MNILVVEDEIAIANALKQILTEAGYHVDAVHDGQEGLTYATDGMYDAILLDLMLPSLDGFEITKRLRQAHIDTPIIILSARSEISDKIQGLDFGADDYMTKPFTEEELLARLRAATRRTGEVILNEITFADLTLNLSSRELECNGKNIALSQKEFEVLEFLLKNNKQTMSKELMISKIWGVDSDAADNNVEAYISFLRKKLSYLNSRASIITIRRLGYRIVDEDVVSPKL